MDNTIKRSTGLLIIEVVNSNPNGDPDRESDPRQRPNGLGEISPVSFKRKLRDLVEDTEGPVFTEVCDKLDLNKADFDILESRGRVRKDIIEEMGKDIKNLIKKSFWTANSSRSIGMGVSSETPFSKRAAIKDISRPALLNSRWGFQ